MMKNAFSIAFVISVVAVYLPTTTSQVTPPSGWAIIAGSFNGQTKKIINPATNRFWHNDGGTTRWVSSIWQPNDEFIYFTMTYDPRDLTYKFTNRGDNVCDGHGTPMVSLHTNNSECTNEARTRFYIYADNPETNYLIQSKYNSRYVRLNTSNYTLTTEVSTNIYSVFRFINRPLTRR